MPNSIQRERILRGYPKLGTILTAIRSGFTSISKGREIRFENGEAVEVLGECRVKEFHLTRGKKYVVIDNSDFEDWHFHVKADDCGYVHLCEGVLWKFFGIRYPNKPKR